MPFSTRGDLCFLAGLRTLNNPPHEGERALGRLNSLGGLAQGMGHLGKAGEACALAEDGADLGLCFVDRVL